MLAVVLGPLEQRLHRLGAEPVALPVALVHQAVGLVDEQHPAEGRVDQLVGLDRGRAEVLADQVGALRLDHLGAVEQPERVEDLADHPGHGGLAGARRAEEDEVPHRLVGAEAGHRPAAGRLDRHVDRVHLLLDRPEADHRVQLGQRVLGGDRRLGLLHLGRRAAACGSSGRRTPGRRPAPARRTGPASDRRPARRGPVLPARAPGRTGRRRGRPGAVRRGRRDRGAWHGGGGVRGVRREHAVRAEHAGFLRSLSRAPADHGGRDHPDRDHRDMRVLRPGLDDEEDRPAIDHSSDHATVRPGHEPAGQRADVRDGGDRERRRHQGQPASRRARPAPGARPERSARRAYSAGWH